MPLYWRDYWIYIQRSPISSTAQKKWNSLGLGDPYRHSQTTRQEYSKPFVP